MANIVDILLKVTDKASGDLKSFQDQLKKTGSIGEFVSENLGKLSFAAAGTALLSFGKQVIENVSNLEDLADTLKNTASASGQNIETIQALELAASRSAIPIETLRNGLFILNKELGNASLQGGIAEEKFTNLGISIRNSAGDVKSSEEILLELSDALKNIENPAQRASLASELLGKQSKNLIPLLEGGRESIQGFVEDLDNFGGKITEDTLVKLSQFEEKMNQIESLRKETQLASIDTALLAADAYNLWSIGINTLVQDFLTLGKIINDPSLSGESQESKIALQKELNAETQRSIAITEEQSKEEEKRLALLQKEQDKYNESLAKMRAELSEKLSTEGLDDVSKALQENDNWLAEIIQKYGVDLPEAFEIYDKKHSQIMKDASDRLQEVNDDLDSQIAKLKASQEISETGRRLAETEIAKSELGKELETFRKGGASEEKIAEFEKLRLQEIDDSFEETTETIREFKEETEDTNESVTDLSKSVIDFGESSTKSAGSLKDAIAGMDAIGAKAAEFSNAFTTRTGASAFGTAGIANDAESLLLVADRARAEALRESIFKAQTGQIDASKLEEWIAEFNKISEQLGGLGTINGSGRQGAMLGERKVVIEFNPQQDFDNLSMASQRQIANAIGGAISG